MSETDRIEKAVLLRAPRARVWQALTDARQFSEWFGVNMEGRFKAGASVRGKITHKGYEHLTMEIVIERMEAERFLSWRWHPGAIDPKVDYSSEPMTRVAFTLTDQAGGTRLQVVESGFDRIPPERRTEAFRMNDGGWTAQMENIYTYVAKTS